MTLALFVPRIEPRAPNSRPLAANGTRGDSQTSIVYDANTGELAVDAPSDTELTSIGIESSAGIFTGSRAQNLGGQFDEARSHNIFKVVFAESFGSLSLGNVAPREVTEEFMRNDLSVVGSIVGGDGLGDVDLIYVQSSKPPSTGSVAGTNTPTHGAITPP